ncbi:carbohydrate ABC transporter permease [Elstera cyanobacteriorum]|uniref:ABC transporter permease n=1 Tax=Elstera cyanobacteriorum TaxID=2022747 RepID=A0A255XM10_9PROT|nr:sugar ABC transporter permease [Elstera cyanobacteriorum]MCK6443306.1 sugar ABC transporter permease [Elstera cyanobacteriorum]OYQ17485.1 ABC transporter permease [Elstera cyanobacteriorum]GFZ94332.1 sugar ABC transporter permease [Elstera cyanobacteriorum]
MRFSTEHLTIRQRQAMTAYLFLAVPAVFYTVIRFYPALESFYLSLTRWNIVSPTKQFVGLANYERLMKDPLFWKVMGNTFEYVGIGLPVGLALSFLIAYFLDKVSFGQGFLRALYFLPHIASTVAMAWVWRWLYQPPPIGLFNNLITDLGGDPQRFLTSTTQAIPAITAPVVWAGLGFNVVIFLAGLKAIPETYYEAARIDGASNWQILRRITLPLLKPTILFLAIINTIHLLRIFDQVYNMTQDGLGGPVNSTKPIVLHIYQTAFHKFDMGYASAATVVLFAILMLITLIQMKLLGKKP